MKIFIFISLCLWSALSSAELRITGISGYSRIADYNQTIDKPPVKIYGGNGANNNNGTCQNKTGTSTCNSCTATEAVCNLTQVYSTLTLSFTLFSTSMTSGSPRITHTPSGGSETGINAAVSAVTAVNQTRIVTTTWADICSAIPSGDPNCGTSGQLSIKVGIDQDGGGFATGDDFWTITVFVRAGSAMPIVQVPGTCTGLCKYTLFPGDEKAYIQDVIITPISSLTIAKAYFFCEAGTDNNSSGYDDVFPEFDPVAFSLNVSSNTFVEDTITGFTNDQTFYCRTALEDDAGNIGSFSARGFGGLGGDDGFDPAGATGGSCPTGEKCHFVKPSAVIGLFNEKQQCFIATAAFGSPLDPYVVALKQFRKKFLLTHAPGKAFVRWYYKTGPVWAQWIKEDPTRMFWTRIFLVPVIAFAYSLLYWPWTLSLAVFAVFFYLRRQRKVLA